MASRRLAISSLLCADDPDAAVAGPSSHSPPELSQRTPAPETTVYGFAAQTYRSPPPSNSSAWQVDSVRSISPLALQPPSPRSQVVSPRPPSLSRRSYKEIVLDDNYTGQFPSVTSPSANNAAVDTLSHNYRGHSSHHSAYSPVHTSLNGPFHAHERGEAYILAESQPSTSFVPSPSHSPIIPYASSHRRTSQASDLPRQAPYSNPPQLSPHRVYQQSLSPLQQAHQPLSSPTFNPPAPFHNSPQYQTRPSSSQRSPTQSRHHISSLLTHSPAHTHISAASLPHILNSPVASTAALTEGRSGGQFGNSGMEGLEALVQAATQERRRLDEVAEDALKANSPHGMLSPIVMSPDGNLHSSPVLNRSAAMTMASPVMSRISPRNLQQPPSASPPTYSHGSPTQPFLPSPRLPTDVLPRLSTHPTPPRQLLQATTDPDIATNDINDIEPSPKRRRSSDRSLDAIPSRLGPDAPSICPSSPENGMSNPFIRSDTGVTPTPAQETNASVHIQHEEMQASQPAPTSAVPIMDVKHEPTDIVSVRGPSSPIAQLAPSSLSTPEVKPKAKKKRSDGKDVSKVNEKGKDKERISKPSASSGSRHTSHVHDKGKNQGDDTDDWFLEQFGDAEKGKTSDTAPTLPSASSFPTRRPDAPEPTHRKRPPSSSIEHRVHPLTTKRPPSRSPTPIALLEAELDDVALVPKPSASPSHPTTSVPNPVATTVPDMDLDTELERAVTDEVDKPVAPARAKPKPRPRPKAKPKVEVEDAMDLDVENELLALLDDDGGKSKDKKYRTHPSQPQPQTTSDHPEGKYIDAATGHSRAGTAVQGEQKSKSKTSKAASSEAGLMLPPESGGTGDKRDATSSTKVGKDTAAATSPMRGTPVDTPTPTPTPTPGPSATGKSKDGTHASKKKAPPKPKPKAGGTSKTKQKPSAVKERSATPAGSPHPTPNLGHMDASAASSKNKKSQSNLAAKRAVSAATGGASRSRSTSVMPGEVETTGKKRSGQSQEEKSKEDEKDEEGKEVDDRLYCVCRSLYDEDRVMIACDRCDEWYHTQCVNMPDLEVDLVDQFICPICVTNNPHLSLRTTYKKRCLAGTAHPRPNSQLACHKPARGVFSKYCSDECGVRFMRERIERHAKEVAKAAGKGAREGKEEGELRGLWEAVKGVGRREAVVVRVFDDDSGKGDGSVRTEVVVPRMTKHARLVARLEAQLEKISIRRDELKAEEELVGWRAAVVEFAARRADKTGLCGWDGRLLWSDEEVREFGAEVVEAYERAEMKEERGSEMAVDGVDESDEHGEWWCTGKKKCDRHAGWQKLRQAEVELENELFDAELERLTTREREIRRRIEDVTAAHPDSQESLPPSPSHAARTGPLHPLNGVAGSAYDVEEEEETPVINANGVNGLDGANGKKGKKRKVEAR